MNMRPLKENQDVTGDLAARFAKLGVKNSSARSEIYPPIEPNRTGFLQVSDIYSLYWEESGNPEGQVGTIWTRYMPLVSMFSNLQLSKCGNAVVKWLCFLYYGFMKYWFEGTVFCSRSYSCMADPEVAQVVATGDFLTQNSTASFCLTR